MLWPTKGFEKSYNSHIGFENIVKAYLKKVLYSSIYVDYVAFVTKQRNQTKNPRNAILLKLECHF